MKGLYKDLKISFIFNTVEFHYGLTVGLQMGLALTLAELLT